ncbi:MAG: hypothetical protein RSD08_02120 [Oscillospiraceae bacterium]
METKKSTLLKVVSIIMIIGGALYLVMGAISLFGAFGVAAVPEAGTPLIFAVLGLVNIAMGAFNLAAGITGSKAASGNGNVKLCKNFAIIILVLAVLSLALNIFWSLGTDQVIYNIISSIVGITLPVLYFIGAKKVSE